VRTSGKYILYIYKKNDNERVERLATGSAFREVTEDSGWGLAYALDCERTILLMMSLSCGAAGDVFGIHGDKVVYDDCAHGEGTESVCEGVQSVVGHMAGIGKARQGLRETVGQRME
jgi:hypothetical protein